MGILNIDKAIEEGRKIIRRDNNTMYDIRAESLYNLARKTDDIYCALGNAFMAGIFQGYKTAKKEEKNNSKMD